jgi:hypothetical protein
MPSMLASFPASILNQIPPESGNPLDSIKKQDALVDRGHQPDTRAYLPALSRKAHLRLLALMASRPAVVRGPVLSPPCMAGLCASVAC